MQLDRIQERIVKSKPCKVSLLKGIKGTGKTTTAVYRTHYLKNNYCLYDRDRILVLAKDSINRDMIRNMYNKFEDYSKVDYQTLFSNAVDRVDILTLEDIISRFYFEYTNSEKKWFKIILETEEKLKIIEKCLQSIMPSYNNLKLFSNFSTNFFLDEIEWMKACNYRELAAYQCCERIGRRYGKGEGPARLLKNSRERKAIFDLFQSYNVSLAENGTIDNEDIAYLALGQAKKKMCGIYTHIIVDEGQALTKTQIDFVLELLINNTYSSLMFTINKSEAQSNKAWISKGRKVKALDINSAVKTYNLSNFYKTVEKEILGEGEKLMNSNDIKVTSMECFEYIDLKHHRKMDFKRDSDVLREIVDEDDNVFTEGNLAQLSVFSDIAAGEPIMMSSEQEAEFYLPIDWIKAPSKCFVLKVKGDSMIGANIFDGDLVVLSKQNTAQNGDIVAAELEGSATLKRLSLNKGTAMLMPENDKYSPIFLQGRQVSILGIAIGVIKNKN